ncbi:hypothetical protein TorRG33x02_115190 [Trema orientale]|uniref:Uncharacterized protein n=1 Tax=Trema orientale TaxID=63057 RepID=A0A2P5F4I4_TREOI|nr:hypothetical protein TorRG33x02_115190 [Trema orientale]
MLPENERITFSFDFDWSRGESIDDRKQFQLLSRYTTKYFENFIDGLSGFYYLERLKLDESDLSSVIVEVEAYMIPRTLARILVLLLRKHGDIGCNSKSAPEMKSIIVPFLCKALHNMSTTKATGITKDRLKEWYFYLKYAQRRGFNVEFMVDHLKDVGRAYIGLQSVAERKLCDIGSVQANDILELQSELDLLINSKCYTSFISWGKFLMECSSTALKLTDKDHIVGGNLF